jgi:transcriptional regulator with XRE-family HTH domain
MRGRNARTDADTSVSRTVADNVRRLRSAQGMSGRALTRKIQENGHRFNQSSLQRIELGQHAQGSLRAVTVDELVWLAEALDVPPTRLLQDSKCPTCNDSPPQGFICRDCGIGADRG